VSEESQDTREQTAAAEDLKAILRDKDLEIQKRAKDLERLEKIAAKYDARLKDDEARERKRAEEQGEWKRLHEEAEGRAKAVEAEKAKTAAKLEAYEAHIRSQVEQTVKAIEDSEARKRVEAAIDGLDPVKADEVVRAMMALAHASTPASPKAGIPGRPRSPKPDLTVLADRGPRGEQARLQATLAALKTSGVFGGER